MSEAYSYFEKIIGNEQVKKHLSHILENGAIANSMLFAGKDGIGKSLFAHALAHAMLCHPKNDPQGRHKHKILSGNHPDIRVYRPEGKVGMHSIDSIRQLTHEVYQPPHEGAKKFFIIHDAERMLPYSANALLKTFEEPILSSIIILLSSSPETLLPTIISRCRLIRFSPLESKDISSLLIQKLSTHIENNDESSEDNNISNITTEEIERISIMSEGSLSQALLMATEENRAQYRKTIELLSMSRSMTYKEISRTISEIAEVINENKKSIEEHARKELFPSKDNGGMSILSAAQREGIEKEIDGAVSKYFIQASQQLLGVILGWYRDLHLLSNQCNANVFLICKDKKDELIRYLKMHRKLATLDDVQQAIGEAKLALERSTSLNIVLEGLFLKLGF